ncbi:MAG: hypothetical protein NC517_08180 [Firmicutes bacterium]|nr:hypothetical protein [Bacillota bacterium]
MKRLWSVCALALIVAGIYLYAETMENTENLLEMRIRRNFSKTVDPMSAVMQIEMTDSENITLTYLEGENYTEVSETIKMEKNYGTGRIKQDDSCPDEWQQAYLAYLETDEYADAWTYSLIYVDDDDIPELVIDTGFEAGGLEILTFHDHVLNVWQSARLNVTYIERGNLICNSDGNMGHYYDEIYTIRDGEWVYVDGGTWGDGPTGIQLDENGDFIYVYNWSGEDVSEEDYLAHLNTVYPEEQGMYPQKYYILDDITSILRTGDVASAGHRYELVVEDVTWKEAPRLCQKKGGYLATVTSQEECKRLQEQIISENKENITFFVGAANERVEDIPFGYRWLEPESKDGYHMLTLSNALFRFWLEGEPSYTGFTEDGREVREEYVVLFYRRSDDQCYLNDVPDDILETAPSYAGKVGYICEYE